MDDEDLPKAKPSYSVGMPLDTLSIDELENTIGVLEVEIERLRMAIKNKSASRDAAESVFKL